MSTITSNIGTIKPFTERFVLDEETNAIRRMRIGCDSPLVPALKEAGIPHEQDMYSDNTIVFEFTIDHGGCETSRRS